MAGTGSHPIIYSSKAVSTSPLDWNAAWAWFGDAITISDDDVTIVDDLSVGGDIAASGSITGTSLTDGVATLSAGSLTGAVNGTFSGTVTSGSRIGGITTVTDTYTILVTDETIVCNKATAFTVTLPAAVTGQMFTIKNIGAGVVTVDGDGGDTIDGETTQDVYQWSAMKVQCIAANAWGIV